MIMKFPLCCTSSGHHFFPMCLYQCHMCYVASVPKISGYIQAQTYACSNLQFYHWFHYTSYCFYSHTLFPILYLSNESLQTSRTNISATLTLFESQQNITSEIKLNCANHLETAALGQQQAHSYLLFITKGRLFPKLFFQHYAFLQRAHQPIGNKATELLADPVDCV